MKLHFAPFILATLFSSFAFAAPEPTVPAETTAPAVSANPMDGVLTSDSLQSVRDPFQMPTIVNKRKENPKSDLEITQLKDIRLNGVISGPKKVKALLSVPNGNTYFVAVGDRVGIREGKVSKIRPGSVTVTEFDTDEFGKKISEQFEIKINGEVISLSEEGGR